MSTPNHHAERIPLVSLTSAEVRRLVKPHAGFEEYAKELVALYESRGDALGRGAFDGPAILAALAEYKALALEEAAARLHLDRIRHTRLKLSSTVWSGMLEIYARALVAGRRDGTIWNAIERFRHFMKHAPRKKAVAP